MNKVRLFAGWTVRFVALYILYLVLYVTGTMAVAGLLPADAPTEPGVVSMTAGLLVNALAALLLITTLVLTSRWHGWKLALSLAGAYYGAVTFLMQIETWYFLSSVTVSPQLLPRLFMMGVPVAFLFIPAAVWMLGRGRAAAAVSPRRAPVMRGRQWAWKLALLVAAYLLLYWGAGYFIAWQNPELRAFYGRPGPALPFVAHTTDTLRHDPWLFPFQMVRALLWILCAWPILRGSRVGPWWTALLVGLLFSVPQNIGHLMANPLLPVASVRLSHLVETASSTFLYGTLVVWLLHRAHHGWRDLWPRPATRAAVPSVAT